MEANRMTTSQKELAVLYVSDVLKMANMAKQLDGLDDEECLVEARNKISGFLGKQKLADFEAYLSNGH